MILSVQCALGAAGSKPVTQLSYPTGPYHALVNTGSHQYAGNDGGLWQLNYRADTGYPTDDGLPITYAVTLNTSHFGKPYHAKKLRYLYVTLSGEYGEFEVNTTADSNPTDYWSKATPSLSGFRAAVGGRRQGIFWTVGFETSSPFTLFNISTLYLSRSLGVSNGCKC